MAELPSTSEMERAYLNKDASYDGVFFLAVRTTGVFCKPSCAARKPLKENVSYFRSAKEAIFAGYRPCKRCRPMQTNGNLPGWVGQLFSTLDRDPAARYTDARLRSMGVEPARARRFFQKRYGMTFQAYCRGLRLGKSLEQIRQGTDLDDVALGYGYDSHSGFREAFVKTFGTPPGRSRSTDCIVATWIESPMGPLVAAATAEGVCLLEFTDRRMLDGQFRAVRRIFNRAVVPGSNKHLEQLREELKNYFDGTLKKFTVSVIAPGTPFQQKVWNELLKIPYGTTTSYEEIARRIHLPDSTRAVGTANGLNRIAIVIPCHRVVNKSGELGGYGGGMWRKRALLDLEKGIRSLF